MKPWSLGSSLRRIQAQPGVLYLLAGAGRKHDVRVQRGAPPSQEPALDLRILRKTSLSDLLTRDSVLLESSSERILTRTRVLAG